MFEKFGEFGSYEEINAAAAGFKDEGDYESIRLLAKENGLDPEDAEDYIVGDMESLCNVKTAALGRLTVMEEDSKIEQNIKRVVFKIAQSMAANNPEDAQMFMKKGTRLDSMIEEMRKQARKEAKGGVGCVCGTDLELVLWIRKTYGRA